MIGLGVLVLFTLVFLWRANRGLPSKLDQCLSSCPDNWEMQYFTSFFQCCACDAPPTYKGPCNVNSNFFGRKYHLRMKRVQWAQNCDIPWTACGYTQDMVDGKVETPHLDEYHNDEEEEL